MLIGSYRGYTTWCLWGIVITHVTRIPIHQPTHTHILYRIYYIYYILYIHGILYIWYKYIIYYILYIYIIYPRFYRFPAPSVSFLEAPTWSPWQDWPLRSFALRGRRWPEEAQMGCDWYDTARCWIWLLCHGHGGFLWGLLCIIMGLYGIIWWYHTRVYLMVI